MEILTIEDLRSDEIIFVGIKLGEFNFNTRPISIEYFMPIELNLQSKDFM
jgi:hypothetical protein